MKSHNKNVTANSSQFTRTQESSWLTSRTDKNESKGQKAFSSVPLPNFFYSQQSITRYVSRKPKSSSPAHNSTSGHAQSIYSATLVSSKKVELEQDLELKSPPMMKKNIFKENVSTYPPSQINNDHIDLNKIIVDQTASFVSETSYPDKRAVSGCANCDAPNVADDSVGPYPEAGKEKLVADNPIGVFDPAKSILFSNYFETKSVTHVEPLLDSEKRCSSETHSRDNDQKFKSSLAHNFSGTSFLDKHDESNSEKPSLKSSKLTACTTKSEQNSRVGKENLENFKPAPNVPPKYLHVEECSIRFDTQTSNVRIPFNPVKMDTQFTLSSQAIKNDGITSGCKKRKTESTHSPEKPTEIIAVDARRASIHTVSIQTDRPLKRKLEDSLDLESTCPVISYIPRQPCPEFTLSF